MEDYVSPGGKQKGEPISAGRVWMTFKGAYAWAKI